MTIIDKIRETIEPIVGEGNFYYADKPDMNVIMENASFPMAFSNLVDASAVEDTLGFFRERITLEVWFTDLTSFDIDAFENERILDAQKRKAFEWLHSLRKSQSLIMEEGVTTQRYYIEGVGACALATAFVVRVTIKEAESSSPCNG